MQRRWAACARNSGSGRMRACSSLHATPLAPGKYSFTSTVTGSCAMQRRAVSSAEVHGSGGTVARTGAFASMPAPQTGRPQGAPPRRPTLGRPLAGPPRAWKGMPEKKEAV